MTQNVYSGSSAGDRRDDSPDSTEIRADIDQTRASVGEKIDKLQARLDPNRLKEQAQETVQEMISDTADSLTQYVRTHRDDMVSSLADAARRNPLPTAFIGLGIGWLLLETLAGNKRHDDDDRWESEQRNMRSRFMGSTGRSQVSQGRGQYMEQDYANQAGYGQYGASQYGSGQTTSGQYASGQVGSTQYGQANYSSTGSSESYGSSNASARSEYQGQQEYGNGHQRGGNPLTKAASTVRETVGDLGSEIKDRVGDVTEEIRDRMGDVKDRMGNVRERVGGTVGDMRQQAGQMRGQTQQSLTRASYQMEEWQARARYEGQRRGQQMMRNLEDNPLTYGAVALAAGAALALLLPQTRTERRYMGEMSDQLMERGENVVESARSRAQEVVSEIRPELEEKARQIVSDAKEMGREVISDAKEMGKEAVRDAAAELRPVVDKAVSKSKEEARNVAQEAGVNPDKLTSGSSSTGASGMGQAQGTMPAINRDTMRGQWTQLKGEVKSKWGQLTDDELTRVEGDYEKLVGAIQTRYGYERARTEQEINDFFKSRKA